MIMIIIIINKEQKKKKIEKTLKYKDHIIRIQGMWNVIVHMIPVIVGATGTTSKSLRQCTGKASSQGTTEKSHIGHCTHTLRKVLM